MKPVYSPLSIVIPRIRAHQIVCRTGAIEGMVQRSTGRPCAVSNDAVGAAFPK